MSFYTIESVDSEVIKLKWAIPKVTPEQFATWGNISGSTEKTSTWRNINGVIECDGFTMTDATFYVSYYFYQAFSRADCAQGINELLLSSGVQNTYHLNSITNKGWDNQSVIPLTNGFSFYVYTYGITSFYEYLGIRFPTSGGWQSPKLTTDFWGLVYANNTLYIAQFTSGSSSGSRVYDIGATGNVTFRVIGIDQNILNQFLNSGEQTYRFTTRMSFDDEYIISPSIFNNKNSQHLTIDMLNIVYDGSPFCNIPIENFQVQLPDMFQQSPGKRLGTFLSLNTSRPSTVFDHSTHSMFVSNIFDNVEYINPTSSTFSESSCTNANVNCNVSYYRNANESALTAFKHEWVNHGTLGLRMNIVSDLVAGTFMPNQYWSGPFLYPQNYPFNYPTGLGEYTPSNWNNITGAGYYSGFLFFYDLLTDNIIIASASLIPSEYGSTNGRIHLEFDTVTQLIPNGSLKNGNIALVSVSEPEPYDRPDPYNPGGTSGEGGGSDGTYARPTEDVPVPLMPTLSPVATKFISVFSPTLAQLNDFASFLWSDAFSVPTLKKIFTNPIDLVLGASIVPVEPLTDTVTRLVFGGFDSGVSMNHVSSIYKDVDCGTIQVNPFWDNFIDYAPYTKLSIFLPFIGVHELLIDDFMKHTITVKYRINLLSGACIAYLIQDNASHPKVLYQFAGNCATNIPVTDRDYSQNIFSSIITATMLGSSIATIASGVGAGGLAGSAMIGEGVASLASSVKNVSALKPSYHRASGVTGESGLLGVRTPYLIFEAFQQSLPQSLNKFNGLPINATYVLNTLKGFTQVKYIRLNSVPATSEELDEIVALLKEGVIL